MKRSGIAKGALLGAVLFLSGCSMTAQKQETAEEAGPVVNFRAIVLGSAPETGMEELYEQLDALTVPELSCTLRFDFIPWGDERKQLNIATASGEYDFIPGGTFSDYRTLVSKNAFLDLNDYLHLVPELQRHYETYSKTALKDCEINGGLYGIPQFGPGEIKNVSEGFFYREDLRREWGLLEISDLETMEAYLYRAKQEEQYRDEPLITDNRIWQSLWLLITGGKYLEVNSMQETPFVVVAADDPYVVINRLETPEFQEVLAYIRKWRMDGILESDLLARSDNEGLRGKNLMLQDKKPCETNVPIWSASASHIPDLTQQHPDWEYGFFSYVSMNEEWYIGSLAESSVVSVSSKTRYPEIAVRLLEKIHTDQRYYNLIKYGVEGIHYRDVDGKVSYEGIGSDDRFGWTVCTDALMNLEDIPVNAQWSEEVEITTALWLEEISKEAKPYPLYGFTFSTNGLEKEEEAMESAKLKYFQPLVCGYMEDYEEELLKTNAALQAAGLDRYISELQSQIDETFLYQEN